MSESLPETWAWAVPGELAAAERNALGIGPFGSNLKVSDYRDSGVPLIFVRNIRSEVFGDAATRFVSPEKAKELASHAVQPNDVLITKMGEPPGDSTVYPVSRPVGIITADCVRWRVDAALGESRFFAYATRSPEVRSQILAITRGVAQRKVSLDRFRTVRYPVAPREEQRRIVEAIESYFSRLDDAQADLARVQRNLERYRASVLQAAVEGRLVPTEAELARAEGRDYEPASALLERILAERRRRWEEVELAKMKGKGNAPRNDGWKRKYQEPEQPDLQGLATLPEGWCWTTLDSFLVNLEAGKSFKCDERPPKKDEVGVVKVSSVTWGTFNEEESKTCTQRGLIRDDFFIKAGDFLFSRANTIELVGACVVVGHISKTRMLSDKILRLTFVEPWSAWLLWTLRSIWGRKEIERLATGNQESMRNISQANLRRIRVPLPPSHEAERIVRSIETALSIADQARRSASANAKRFDRLRQSILKWAFEGRLVDQDPTDEPASALLERIAAERDAAMSAKPSRKRATDKARSRRP